MKAELDRQLRADEGERAGLRLRRQPGFLDDRCWPACRRPQARRRAAITTYSATGNIRRHGKMVFVSFSVSVTANGTGSGFLSVVMPFTSAALAVLSGRETTTGAAVTGLINGASSVVTVEKYDGSYPVTSGSFIAMSGWVIEA